MGKERKKTERCLLPTTCGYFLLLKLASDYNSIMVDGVGCNKFDLFRKNVFATILDTLNMFCYNNSNEYMIILKHYEKKYNEVFQANKKLNFIAHTKQFFVPEHIYKNIDNSLKIILENIGNEK